MQHESAPGADAERAQGVCARRSNALKRLLNAGLASCLLWEQQAAPIHPSAGVFGASRRRRRCVCGAVCCLVYRQHVAAEENPFTEGNEEVQWREVPARLWCWMPHSLPPLSSGLWNHPATPSRQCWRSTWKRGNAGLVHVFSSALRLIPVLIDSSNNQRFSLFSKDVGCLQRGAEMVEGMGFFWIFYFFFPPPCVAEHSQPCLRGSPGAPTNEPVSSILRDRIFSRWWRLNQTIEE